MLRFGSADVNFYRWENNGPCNTTDPLGLAPRQLKKGEECLLAIVHVAINNLTETEFNKLLADVKIDDNLTQAQLEKLSEKTLTDVITKAPGFGGLLNALGTGFVLAAFSSHAAVTLPAILTGAGTVIYGKSNGPVQGGQFGKTVTAAGAIDNLGQFALIGHELQHAVQILRDGTKDGQGYITRYVNDFLIQAQQHLDFPLDVKKVQNLAYHAITMEIQGHAIEDALNKVLAQQKYRDMWDCICTQVYDPKKGLISLAGNKDVQLLRATITAEYIGIFVPALFAKMFGN
jgi:hypothetical protein